MRGRESDIPLVTLTIFGLFLLAVSTALALVIPATAAASVTGDITRTEVDQGWTTAALAGLAVEELDCEEGPEGPVSPEGGTPVQPKTPPSECGWIAYATVGPGTSISDCSSSTRRLNSIGTGVQVLWEGEEVRGAGLAQFDLSNVDLDYGAAAPLLCLSVVEAVRVQVECQEGEEACPPYAVVHRYRHLDAALLEPVPLPILDPPASVGPLTSEPIIRSPKPCARVKAKHQRRRQQRAKASLSHRVKVSRPARRRGCRHSVSVSS